MVVCLSIKDYVIYLYIWFDTKTNDIVQHQILHAAFSCILHCVCKVSSRRHKSRDIQCDLLNNFVFRRYLYFSKRVWSFRFYCGNKVLMWFLGLKCIGTHFGCVSVCKWPIHQSLMLTQKDLFKKMYVFSILIYDINSIITSW